MHQNVFEQYFGKSVKFIKTYSVGNLIFCKSTFSLVACKPVGKNQYLQMDLDTPCYQAEHFAWLFRLFFPSLFCYVLGLPILSTLMLRCNKKHLEDPRVKFRFGILFDALLISFGLRSILISFAFLLISFDFLSILISFAIPCWYPLISFRV